MEFMEKCCFILPLKRGAAFLDIVASGLCVVNIVYSSMQTVFNSKLNTQKVIHGLIFIIVNIVICSLVQFMTYYSTRGSVYKWYIGFNFFVFVISQMIAVIIVLTEFMEDSSTVGIAITTLLLTAVLFYFVLVVISIFYHNGEQLRIQEELRLRESSMHVVSGSSNLKKRYLIPLNPSTESIEEK